MTIEFRASGDLRHTVEYADRLQIADHPYRIEDDAIFVKPAGTNEHELGRFTFDGPDRLVLVCKGKRSWFRRDRQHLTGRST